MPLCFAMVMLKQACLAKETLKRACWVMARQTHSCLLTRVQQQAYLVTASDLPTLAGRMPREWSLRPAMHGCSATQQQPLGPQTEETF